MGMFDTVKLSIRCPNCGETSEMEAQTKELDCNLETWRVGNFVTRRLNWLTCLASCAQPACKAHVIKEHGYWGGFGRMFYVKIFLHNGKVSGEYEIISENDDGQEED